MSDPMTPTTRPALTDEQRYGVSDTSNEFGGGSTRGPALTEPATEAGRALLEDVHTVILDGCAHHFGNTTYSCSCRADLDWRILAIEVEAVQREREALVERVAKGLYRVRADTLTYIIPEWDEQPPSIQETWRAETRRLLGLDA